MTNFKSFFLFLLICTVAISACQTRIENPSGNCRIGDNKYIVDNYRYIDNVQLLVDCQNPLQRQYWSVFVTDETGSATIHPAPGQESLTKTFCENPEESLALLADKYELCQLQQNSTGSFSPDFIYSPQDALAITRALHRDLRFQVSLERRSVTPGFRETDVIGVCRFNPDENSPEMQVMCEREQLLLDTGWDAVNNYYDENVFELANGLNKLYGID